jgi:hypothetical protein
MSDWQPIETAPKDGTIIIGHEPRFGIYGGALGMVWIPPHTRMFHGHKIEHEGYWGSAVHNVHVCKPTHWMPFPELPKE